MTAMKAVTEVHRKTTIALQTALLNTSLSAETISLMQANSAMTETMQTVTAAMHNASLRHAAIT